MKQLLNAITCNEPKRLRLYQLPRLMRVYPASSASSVILALLAASISSSVNLCTSVIVVSSFDCF